MKLRRKWEVSEWQDDVGDIIVVLRRNPLSEDTEITWRTHVPGKCELVALMEELIREDEYDMPNNGEEAH